MRLLLSLVAWLAGVLGLGLATIICPYNLVPLTLQFYKTTTGGNYQYVPLMVSMNSHPDTILNLLKRVILLWVRGGGIIP